MSLLLHRIEIANSKPSFREGCAEVFKTIEFAFMEKNLTSLDKALGSLDFSRLKPMIGLSVLKASESKRGDLKSWVPALKRLDSGLVGSDWRDILEPYASLLKGNKQ